jgi:hypothetical protein
VAISFARARPDISTVARPGAVQQTRLTVPWKTVVVLAAVLAYADGFWLTSLQGAVGAIERTQGPFASWLTASTLMLSVYVVAVLGVLTFALRRFGPELRRPREVATTAGLIVAAGTVVGLAAMVTSSAYDYHLQSAQLRLMEAMQTSCSGNCLAKQQHETLAIHVRGLLLTSPWLLLTNLVLVAWVVALCGGRLKVSTRKRQPDDGTGTVRVLGRSRVQELRLLLVGALVGSGAIHAALVPTRLTDWAGAFFVFFAIWEFALAGMLLSRLEERTMLLAATVISIAPVALWVWSRTAGLPFGPSPSARVGIGLPDTLACLLALTSLLAAATLLRTPGWPDQPRSSAHVRSLVLVALIAATAIGVAGTGLSWVDAFGISGPPTPPMDMSLSQPVRTL